MKASEDRFALVAKALASMNPTQHQYNAINIWPDVDLVMVDGTQAEQEATKKVVYALRRVTPHEPAAGGGGSDKIEDAKKTIDHIKHELTYLQQALSEGK